MIKRNSSIRLISFCAVYLSCICAYALQPSDAYEPEHSTKLAEDTITLKKSGEFERAIVVSANHYATNAGLQILKSGGNAIDAMVAVQLVLGLVEPQSSGLGGGAFTLFFDAESKKLISYDGRETAPQNAPDDLFLNDDQSPMSFFEAVVGGRSVGTPGTPALLWQLHQQHGKLKWSLLFDSAYELAKNGFNVSPRLAQSVARDSERLSTDAASAAYFLPNGSAVEQGQQLKNPEYAKTLSLLAKTGGNYFYSEEFATPIIEKVQASTNKGYLELEDFQTYKVIEREPVCTDAYQHRVCGMGPPSSGAIAVNQILSLTERSMPDKFKPESAHAWHVVAEATRRAFADRNRYVADTDFISMPDWLLNPEYLGQRALEIKPDAASKNIQAGHFRPATQSSQRIDGVEIEQPSTTHFVIVDDSGNVVSTTSTIENGFGSRLMVHGFLLNNELTDFSFARSSAHGDIANRVEPGKRPRSSMAPTIVFKNENPVLALGSPGGSRIINYVANSLVRSLAWKQDIRTVVGAPHYSNRTGQMDIEPDSIPASSIQTFEQMGYIVKQRDLNSGLHAVEWREGTLVGAADPRREGTVAGY